MPCWYPFSDKDFETGALRLAGGTQVGDQKNLTHIDDIIVGAADDRLACEIFHGGIAQRENLVILAKQEMTADPIGLVSSTPRTSAAGT